MRHLQYRRATNFQTTRQFNSACLTAAPLPLAQDIQSGNCATHNTTLVDFPHKGVLRAPWRIRPTPFWSPFAKNAEALAPRAMTFMVRLRRVCYLMSALHLHCFSGCIQPCSLSCCSLCMPLFERRNGAGVAYVGFGACSSRRTDAAVAIDVQVTRHDRLSSLENCGIILDGIVLQPQAGPSLTAMTPLSVSALLC